MTHDTTHNVTRPNSPTFPSANVCVHVPTTDGVIKKMFIEPDKQGDPYEVSDAETMLRFINANAKLPGTWLQSFILRVFFLNFFINLFSATVFCFFCENFLFFCIFLTITSIFLSSPLPPSLFCSPTPEYTAIFTKEGCPYCAKAKKMLGEHGIQYEEIVVGKYVSSLSFTLKGANKCCVDFSLTKIILPNSHLLFFSLPSSISPLLCSFPLVVLVSNLSVFSLSFFRNNVSQNVIRAVANASTVPQVFMNGKLIGGSEALEKYLGSEDFKKGTTLASK